MLHVCDCCPAVLNTGVNPRATGSAYVELTHTKIFCAIFGPKESPRRDEFVPQVCAPIRWPHCSSPVVHWFSFPSLQGKLTCEFKFAPFSCPHRRQYQQDQQERDYSSLIIQALQRVVRLETFPKLQLEINIMVLENGGNALAASLVCATLALVDSGVEMLDTPTACSVVLQESGFWVDPALVEEYRGDPVVNHPSIKGGLMVVYLPSLDEVTALKQTGVMKHEDVLKGIDLCVEGCVRVHHRMREFLTEETTKDGQEKVAEHTQTSAK